MIKSHREVIMKPPKDQTPFETESPVIKDEEGMSDRLFYTSGSNQVSLKEYNQRLILHLIKGAGELTKAEVARISKLSPQTVTILVNRLIKEGYLCKKNVRRGKVGLPSTPIALNPDGAITIGLKIGRRTLDILTLTFSHKVIHRQRIFYEYPNVDTIFIEIKQMLETAINQLTPLQKKRLLGIGITYPFGMEGWEGIIGAPKGALAKWKDIDISQKIGEISNLPSYKLNDATAACLAEFTLGKAAQYSSVLYIYLGTFVGGGLIINGQLHTGFKGNAGAIGSLPLNNYNPDLKSNLNSSTSLPKQLIEVVTVHQLETLLQEKGFDRQSIYQEANSNQALHFSDELLNCIDQWIELVAPALAFTIVSGASFIDMDTVIIDGSFASPLLSRLIGRTKDYIQNYNLEGLMMPIIEQGTIGIDARALGGAILPLHANFALDNNVLFKA